MAKRILKSDPQDEVTRFCEKNVKNKKEFGKDARLAFKRHLDDLKRQGTAEFPYIFKWEDAKKVIDFANKLTLVQGKVKEQFNLKGFQIFIIGSLFGWKHKDTDARRFTDSYVQLSRKQGKSILNGILGLYCAGFEGYLNGQIYCTATKADQAKIVLKEIIKFIKADPDLGELFEIKEYRNEITALTTDSVIKALGRDTDTIDGFMPYLGIVDEYHAHKDNQMYKLLEGGTGTQEQYLISVITTAGFNINGPCYELYKYCQRVLKKLDVNESQFIYIAQMDKGDDIFDKNNWIKCCPLTGNDEALMAKMEQIAQKAKAMGGKELLDFMTKRLNIWVQGYENSYIPLEEWEKNATDKKIDAMQGKKAICGLDLSSGGDLTSLVLEFLYNDENLEKKYYIYSHSFIPKMRMDEHMKLEDNAPYEMWARAGLLTPTTAAGGIKTDYKTIISFLKKLIDSYNIDLDSIAYDPHNASAFIADLEDFGVPLIEIKQSARNLSEATEDFKLEVQAQNMEFDEDNKLLTRSINDAILNAPNSFGEQKIDKMTQKNRIDPVDAAICAHKVAMSTDVDDYDINAAVDAFLDL